jgi:hypothetical protein
MRWWVWLVVGGLYGGAWAQAVFAYTAAGDRTFPATLLLPQGAPSDEIYLTIYTLPQAGSALGDARRNTNLSLIYSKTITDRLGISIEETYSRVGRVGADAVSGWQNLDLELKYLALTDLPHEALLTLGLEREVATGAARVGASTTGATTPRIYFGKGAGDLDIGMLRPLAVTGHTGFQFSDGGPHPDRIIGGVAIEYSIPYLQSKVGDFNLPEPFRAMTPITEIAFTTPAGRSYGQRTTLLIGPGISYAAEGWEFAIEALVPATRATGRGAGVVAQFHLSLDFVFPESIGKPLASSELSP